MKYRVVYQWYLENVGWVDVIDDNHGKGYTSDESTPVVHNLINVNDIRYIEVQELPEAEDIQMD